MRAILLSLSSAILMLMAACASDPAPTINQQIRDAFKAADKDGDEQLSPAEFAELPLKNVKFEDVDTDGNGKVSLAELQSYLIWRRVQAEGNRPWDASSPRRRY